MRATLQARHRNPRIGTATPQVLHHPSRVSSRVWDLECRVSQYHPVLQEFRMLRRGFRVWGEGFSVDWLKLQGPGSKAWHVGVSGGGCVRFWRFRVEGLGLRGLGV